VPNQKIYSSSEHLPQEAPLSAVFFKFDNENAIQSEQG